MLPGKTAYATIKSPIDSSNFSNTIHHIGSVMVSILTSSELRKKEINKKKKTCRVEIL
jgi:hypothetical protein